MFKYVALRRALGIVLIFGLDTYASMAGRHDDRHRNKTHEGNFNNPFERTINDHNVHQFIENGTDLGSAEQHDLTAISYQIIKRLLRDPRRLNEPAVINELEQKLFDPDSAQSIAEAISAFMRNEYANALIIGKAGSGKTHMVPQLTSALSFGLMGDELKKKLAIQPGANERYLHLLKHFLGNTNVFLVNTELLNANILEDSDKPWPNSDERRANVLRALFMQAREANKRLRNSMNMPRRTLFIFDEMAELPPLVHSVMKTIADETGFQNPDVAGKRKPDPGFHILGFTTPDEFAKMTKGDSAIERRYKIIQHREISEQQALKILNKKAREEIEPMWNIKIPESSLKLLLHFRNFLTSPPQAMPGNVVVETNDIVTWKIRNPGEDPLVVSHRDIQRYLVSKYQLSDLWFEGPNGEPPFHNLEEEVKKHVKDHDNVVHKICERIKAWARFDFGSEVPVFLLGGPSGSGKDTIVKALNLALFKHEGQHLSFSLAGSQGFALEAIIYGPPKGNHADGESSLLLQAINNHGYGIIAFNEAADLFSFEFNKLKTLLEDGVIRPRGLDSRERPSLFPIFVMGQFGEYQDIGPAPYTDSQIETAFSKGSDEDGRFGAVPRAIIERARATGGIYLLDHVNPSVYKDIIEKHLTFASRRYLNSHGTILKYSDDFSSDLAQFAQEQKIGTRSLRSLATDFSSGLMSKAVDRRMNIFNQNIVISLVKDETSQKIVKAKLSNILEQSSMVRSWEFELSDVLRLQNSCGQSFQP